MRKAVLLYLLLLVILNLFPKVPSFPVSGGDKVVHLLEFLVLGFFASEKWPYFLVFPVVLEALQAVVPGRTFSLADMAANLMGFGAGVLWGWYYGLRKGADVQD